MTSVQRERVTDDIYVFTSNLYAQVTAGLIVTGAGAILIDTLVYPEETRQIKRFVEERLGTRVQFVINTHFHADHTTGTCFFPDAQIIAQERCRALIDERGREGLERMRASHAEMRDSFIVLPTITFDQTITLHFGGKTLEMWSTPGHSPDSIVVHIREDQVLFAADTLMSLPYFVDGDYDDFIRSLESFRGRSYESIVQGHGEVLLRGEVEEKIQNDLDYLVKLRHAVDAALATNNPQAALRAIDIEDCGKSRILLNGAAQQLHQQNVMWLAERRAAALSLRLENGK